MLQIKLANGKLFTAELGETMLDAALRSGVILEHSCKTGRCGACKAKLTSGLSKLVGSEAALTPAERDVGMILSCVREAATDVVLGVEDLGDMRMFPVKTVPCRIQTLERVGSDVLRLILRLPPPQTFDYYPGQYFDLIGKGALCRSYSVANAPAVTGNIELHIRRVPSGEMSDYLFNSAQVNDLLRLKGPLGTFFVRDVARFDLIFLATGTGIAPVKAILEGMAKWASERLPRSIRVYWGGRTLEDLYWDPTEIGLDLEFFPVLSRAGSAWTGFHGYVQQAVLNSGGDLGQATVFACGSLAMIEAARAQLVAAGLSEGRFHSDAFVASSHDKS